MTDQGSKEQVGVVITAEDRTAAGVESARQRLASLAGTYGGRPGGGAPGGLPGGQAIPLPPAAGGAIPLGSGQQFLAQAALSPQHARAVQFALGAILQQAVTDLARSMGIQTTSGGASPIPSFRPAALPPPSQFAFRATPIAVLSGGQVGAGGYPGLPPAAATPGLFGNLATPPIAAPTAATLGGLAARQAPITQGILVRTVGGPGGGGLGFVPFAGGGLGAGGGGGQFALPPGSITGGGPIAVRTIGGGLVAPSTGLALLPGGGGPPAIPSTALAVPGGGGGQLVHVPDPSGIRVTTGGHGVPQGNYNFPIPSNFNFANFIGAAASIGGNLLLFDAAFKQFNLGLKQISTDRIRVEEDLTRDLETTQIARGQIARDLGRDVGRYGRQIGSATRQYEEGSDALRFQAETLQIGYSRQVRDANQRQRDIDLAYQRQTIQFQQQRRDLDLNYSRQIEDLGRRREDVEINYGRVVQRVQLEIAAIERNRLRQAEDFGRRRQDIEIGYGRTVADISRQRTALEVSYSRQVEDIARQRRDVEIQYGRGIEDLTKSRTRLQADAARALQRLGEDVADRTELRAAQLAERLRDLQENLRRSQAGIFGAVGGLVSAAQSGDPFAIVGAAERLREARYEQGRLRQQLRAGGLTPAEQVGQRIEDRGVARQQQDIGTQLTQGLQDISTQERRLNEDRLRSLQDLSVAQKRADEDRATGLAVLAEAEKRATEDRVRAITEVAIAERRADEDRAVAIEAVRQAMLQAEQDRGRAIAEITVGLSRAEQDYANGRADLLSAEQEAWRLYMQARFANMQQLADATEDYERGLGRIAQLQGQLTAQFQDQVANISDALGATLDGFGDRLVALDRQDQINVVQAQRRLEDLARQEEGVRAQFETLIGLQAIFAYQAIKAFGTLLTELRELGLVLGGVTTIGGAAGGTGLAGLARATIAGIAGIGAALVEAVVVVGAFVGALNVFVKAMQATVKQVTEFVSLIGGVASGQIPITEIPQRIGNVLRPENTIYQQPGLVGEGGLLTAFDPVKIGDQIGQALTNFLAGSTPQGTTPGGIPIGGTAAAPAYGDPRVAAAIQAAEASGQSVDPNAIARILTGGGAPVTTAAGVASGAPPPADLQAQLQAARDKVAADQARLQEIQAKQEQLTKDRLAQINQIQQQQTGAHNQQTAQTEQLDTAKNDAAQKELDRVRQIAAAQSVADQAHLQQILAQIDALKGKPIAGAGIGGVVGGVTPPTGPLGGTGTTAIWPHVPSDFAPSSDNRIVGTSALGLPAGSMGVGLQVLDSYRGSPAANRLAVKYNLNPAQAASMLALMLQTGLSEEQAFRRVTLFTPPLGSGVAPAGGTGTSAGPSTGGGPDIVHLPLIPGGRPPRTPQGGTWPVFPGASGRGAVWIGPAPDMDGSGTISGGGAGGAMLVQPTDVDRQQLSVLQDISGQLNQIGNARPAPGAAQDVFTQAMYAAFNPLGQTGLRR